jgi:membrane fusion protein, copper/silver efflux system
MMERWRLMNDKSLKRIPLFWVAAIVAALLLSGLPVGSTGWGVRGVHAAEQKLKAGMIDPKTGKKIKYWVAPMDPKYISMEPGKSPMGMDLVPVYEEAGEAKEPASTIRIDPVTEQNMGVRYGRVVRKPLAKSIRTYGNITYDETRLYTINTKFDGWIDKLYVDFEGEHVRRGQPLFTIYSPDLVSAQQDFLLAVQQMHRLPASASAIARGDARRLLNASRLRLQYWDLTDQQIDAIAKKGAIQKSVTVYSPAAGVVIKKNAFEGHYVKAGVHQFEIADLSTVWVDVDIYEYELPWVRKEMPAVMELPYIPGKRFDGKVLFVYPYLDVKSRTARLRLAFENPTDELKPGMYATVLLKSALPGETLAIPDEAVIDSGARKIVFVSRGKGKFEPRDVRLGVEGDNYEVQVLKGLTEGEKIVVSGQFMLDSESRLREAVQKMLEPAKPADTSQAAKADDLDMKDMKMEDKLDMTGMDMSKTPDTTTGHKK